MRFWITAAVSLPGASTTAAQPARRPHTQVVMLGTGTSNVLLHEVYDAEIYRHRSADRQAYHSAHHTSTFELAELASRARPKLLVMYHQLFWGGDDESLLHQVRSRYDGVVISRRDLAVY